MRPWNDVEVSATRKQVQRNNATAVSQISPFQAGNSLPRSLLGKLAYATGLVIRCHCAYWACELCQLPAADRGPPSALSSGPGWVRDIRLVNVSVCIPWLWLCFPNRQATSERQLDKRSANSFVCSHPSKSQSRKHEGVQYRGKLDAQKSQAGLCSVTFGRVRLFSYRWTLHLKI